MARLTASDLLLSFTDSATTHPSTTEIGNLITLLYRLSYTYIYDNEDYDASDTNDVDSIVDSDGFRAALQTEAQHLTERWHIAGRNNDGNIVQMPRLTLSKEFKKELDLMIKKDPDKIAIDDIRMYGSKQTDYEGVY